MTTFLQKAAKHHASIKICLAIAAFTACLPLLEMQEITDSFIWKYMDTGYILLRYLPVMISTLAYIALTFALLFSTVHRHAAKYYGIPLIFVAIGNLSEIVYWGYHIYHYEDSSEILSNFFAYLSLLVSFLSLVSLIAVAVVNSTVFSPVASVKRKKTLLISLLIFSFAGNAVIGLISVIYCLLFVKPVDDTEDTPPVSRRTASEIHIHPEISQKAQFAFQNYVTQYENESGLIATDSIQAIYFAMAVKLQQLKTPATAKFCELEEVTLTEIGENIYSVSGYVDAQNIFGTIIRQTFSLKVTKTVQNEWKFISK